MKVHKYPIKIADRQVVFMEKDAKLLCVQVQRGVPCIWALVDEMEPLEKRIIYTRGTGHDGSGVAADKYLGTYQIENGALIFHIFDGGSPPFDDDSHLGGTEA